MTIDEAIQVFRKHNDEIEGEPDNLLRNLRPYCGISKAHFTDIVHALLTVAPLLNSDQFVDRDLIRRIWNITRDARLMTRGPHDPMFHGRHFISDSDKRTLDRWIYEIESITLKLLRGFADWEVFAVLANEVNLHDSLENAHFLVRPFCIALEDHLGLENDSQFSDDEELLCEALGKLGIYGIPALPVLRRVATETKFPEVKACAEGAMLAISKFEKTR
jgi:hypothetical protein